jgi:hypothetical protein
MLIPKYILEDLSVGSGLIIGKSNIEEFFNHISMHKEVEEKSLVEQAPSIEVASTYLSHMLETRFASLNPFMQYMFLKLHEIEDTEKKAFILKTLRSEFKDVVIEARRVLKRFNKLGFPIKVIGTNNEGAKILYLASSWDYVKLSKIILTGSVLKIFLMKIVYQSVTTRDTQNLNWIVFISLFL